MVLLDAAPEQPHSSSKYLLSTNYNGPRNGSDFRKLIKQCGVANEARDLYDGIFRRHLEKASSLGVNPNRVRRAGVRCLLLAGRRSAYGIAIGNSAGICVNAATIIVEKNVQTPSSWSNH